MKKLLLPLFIGLSITASSQQVHRCYTTEMMQQREQANPGYLKAVEKTFEMAKEHAQSKGGGGQTIYRIPVVVHVVYENATENIPDSLIYNQIEVLNEDYRRLNADTSLTRSEFLPVAADAGIEFYLADRDPNGNWTTGITRTPTNRTNFFDNFNPDEIKIPANGGKAGWPPSRYLNIWVGDFAGFILGMGYPPAGAPNWPQGSEAPDSTLDGVSIHYEVFGRNNSLAISQWPAHTRGRQCTHEIGHYLGIRHIWGDATFPGDGCNVDDGISDTPNCYEPSQQNCDYNANTCTDSPIDYNDMVENYMDQSSETCQNMFTQGQVDIMRAILETTRGSLVASFPVGINNTESMGVDIFPNPSSGVFNVRTSGSQVQYIQIFDSYGRLVDSPSVNSASQAFSLDLTGYAKGVYFVKFNFEDGNHMGKLVVE